MPLEHTPCTMQRTTGCPWEMPHEVWAGVTPAALLRSACYDSMALLTMAHQPPASSNLSTRPRSCPMRSTWVRVRVRVRVKVRVRVRVRVRVIAAPSSDPIGQWRADRARACARRPTSAGDEAGGAPAAAGGAASKKKKKR